MTIKFLLLCRQGLACVFAVGLALSCVQTSAGAGGQDPNRAPRDSQEPIDTSPPYDPDETPTLRMEGPPRVDPPPADPPPVKRADLPPGSSLLRRINDSPKDFVGVVTIENVTVDVRRFEPGSDGGGAFQTKPSYTQAKSSLFRVELREVGYKGTGIGLFSDGIRFFWIEELKFGEPSKAATAGQFRETPARVTMRIQPGRPIFYGGRMYDEPVSYYGYIVDVEWQR